MKFKFTCPSFISSLALCTIASSLALAETAPVEAPRWFEVEVILFKQLGDKKLLKEQFPDEVSLPEHSNFYDLLTPYLQPNIASLKQSLPLCEQKHVIDEPDPIISSLITMRSLSDIQTHFENESYDNNPAVKSPIDGSIISKVYTQLEQEKEQKQEQEKSIERDGRDITIEQHHEDELPKGLTSNQLALLEAAEKTFAKVQFINAPHYPYFPDKSFCLVPKELLQQSILNTTSDIASDITSFDGFPINQVPKTINASGLKHDSHPYLISKDSLRLNDIITRLKWSKNFKPLLHLGWRQIGITRKKAIPFRLFAGEHLEENYQRALQNKIEIEQAEQEMLANFSDEETNLLKTPLPTALTEREVLESNQGLTVAQQKKKSQLESIFKQLSLLDESTLNEEELAQLISSLDSQSNSDTSIDDNDKTSVLVKPSQPWLLDGFFKVHLDHYLYITANLNITDKDDNAASTMKPDVGAPMKAINFSQNRRVITGEVHYFDHPYIGMLVQIRRFDPTKGDDEAVSQAIR
jgi:hypothetical protein